jgi:uncharacterized phiE125 gp8 family phage protein
MFSKLITGPSAEPVTAAEVKIYTRISHSVEDSLINDWIKSARIRFEDYQQKGYISQTRKAICDNWPEIVFDIPRGPLISVQSVKYYDVNNTEYTLSSDNYYIDTTREPGRFALNDGVVWPSVTLRPINGFEVNYTIGYGTEASDVPQTVKDAIYLYCAYRYENRIAEDGDIPEAIRSILVPDRMVNFAG